MLTAELENPATLTDDDAESPALTRAELLRLAESRRLLSPYADPDEADGVLAALAAELLDNSADARH